METWILYSLISALFSAFTAIFGKFSIQNGNPKTIAFVYFVVATLFMLITLLVSHKIENISFKIPDTTSLTFSMFAGIATGLSWLFYLFALKNGTITQVNVLSRMNLVFIILMCRLVLGECSGIQYFIGAILVVIGSFLISF